jgi:hypothetical protein
MKQSVVTPETLGVIVARVEAVIDRPLTDMEKVLMEYTVDQIRLGLVEVA